MKPGPNPQPADLKLVNGNPGKRKPKGKSGSAAQRLATPKELDTPDAVRCWKRTTKELAGMGILATADRDTLIEYCCLWARWRDVCAFLAANGRTYAIREKNAAPGALGAVRCLVPFPEIAIEVSMMTRLMKFQDSFGLTPAARARINIMETNRPLEAHEAFERSMQDGGSTAEELKALFA